MEQKSLAYPISLGLGEITKLLPHRGEMLFLRRLTVLAHNHYRGIVQWAADSEILRGHFPGLPIVPGVLLVEAVAQAAGAGLLAGDPTVQSMGENFIGVLAGIRKCSFKRPVLPGEAVAVEVRCRQMSPSAVAATGAVTVGDEDAADIEILIINSPRTSIEKYLAGLHKTPP
jgi:3-hydroxyacyl-[acyl-carrier-protein] dehydratase